VGTALLPMLSKAMSANNNGEAQHLFNRAMEICLLLALPAAVALLTIPDALIRVLFERGALTPDETAMTARVLMGYAIGLPAYIVIKVYSTAFWAKQDTKTPVKIAIICTLMNIALAVALSQLIGVVGIALATGSVAWLQIILFRRALKDHPAAKADARFRRNAPKIILASCLMGAALIGSAYGLHDYLIGSTHERVLALVALVAGGSIIYAAVILGSGAIQITEFTKDLKRNR